MCATCSSQDSEQHQANHLDFQLSSDQTGQEIPVTCCIYRSSPLPMRPPSPRNHAKKKLTYLVLLAQPLTLKIS